MLNPPTFEFGPRPMRTIFEIGNVTAVPRDICVNFWCSSTTSSYVVFRGSIVHTRLWEKRLANLMYYKKDEILLTRSDTAQTLEF